MAPFAVGTGPLPVVLGVALTIDRPERLRAPTRGVRTRSVRLRIDPSLDLIYLVEITLPGDLSCLAPLTEPNVVALRLRSARLELVPNDTGAFHGISLTALTSGNCFLTAQSQKVLIAFFDEGDLQPRAVQMQVQSRVNLLEYLRTDWFTIELSGMHRRRLTRALPLRLELEFDMLASAID